MAEVTGIEWTATVHADGTVTPGSTWQPITGCTVVSPGCTNCYAMGLADTRLRHHPSRIGLTQPSKAGPVWTGEVRFNEQWLDQPLRWKRPRRIFVCAHGDLFHESVPDEWIDRVFAVMALAPQHTFQVLTKRAKRMREYMTRFRFVNCGLQPQLPWPITGEGQIYIGQHWPLPNVWLGVSIEDQARADERIPDLLATPAAVRFISAEPLLGPLDIGWAVSQHRLDISVGFLHRGHFSPGMETLRPLDWVIVGGESGPKARPMHPDWPRSLRDQCQAAGVPFFFKQWGEWAPHKVQPGGDLGGDVRADRVRIVHPSARTNVEISIATGGYSTEPGSRYMARVGKKAAGRLLDGRTHDEMPT